MSTPCSSFNPLRRGGGRATDRGQGDGPRPHLPAFQSPPPRRGACDPQPPLDARLLGRAQVSIPSAEAGGVRPTLVVATLAVADRHLFQSPPPRRGACDEELLQTPHWVALRVSIPSAEAGGVRHLPVMSKEEGNQLSFNPLRRGGGRATSKPRRRTRRSSSSSFNPLRRGGGRATRLLDRRRLQGGGTRFNPLRRGGGRATRRRGRLTSTNAACVSIPSAEAGGVRPLACCKKGLLKNPMVSIPSAEAGGVGLRRPVDAGHRRRVAFQSPPPRRGACDAAPPAPSAPTPPIPFQSPPPRRGACDFVRDDRSVPPDYGCFNPLRRGGGRATSILWTHTVDSTNDQFQSPPPRRGACDNQILLASAGADKSVSFNPLRRGGGRATSGRPSSW